jgi:hypothetical protein
MHEEIADDH